MMLGLFVVAKEVLIGQLGRDCPGEWNVQNFVEAHSSEVVDHMFAADFQMPSGVAVDVVADSRLLIEIKQVLRMRQLEPTPCAQPRWMQPESGMAQLIVPCESNARKDETTTQIQKKLFEN